MDGKSRPSAAKSGKTRRDEGGRAFYWVALALESVERRGACGRSRWGGEGRVGDAKCVGAGADALRDSRGGGGWCVVCGFYACGP